MPFRPLTNAVTIRRKPESDVIGMLYLPETRMPTSHILRGTVVAIGPGKHRYSKDGNGDWKGRDILKTATLDPLEVAPGDEVLYYPQYEEQQVIDGERLDVCAEEFILAALEPASEPLPASA